MRSQLGKVKQEVAGAIAGAQKLQQQVEKEKKQAEEWEQRAMLAVQEGRDDLAKQALMRHSEHLQHAHDTHETWVRHKAETEQLKNALRQLNDKIEEARRKRNILIARQKRAEAQGRIQETMSSMSKRSAFENFERMTEKIEETERKVLAAAELSEDLSGDMLQQEFDALEYHGSSDQQLLELKKKMGMISAGEASERPQLGAGESDDVADAEFVDGTPSEEARHGEGESGTAGQ
jgi:phage shock protein A